MFMTQCQLAAAIANRKKTEAHNHRIATDAAYRARIEREQAEYENFVAKFGEPLRGDEEPAPAY